MTKIYLARHGLALSTEVDHGFPLAEQGKDETQKIARALKCFDPKLDNIYHSNKLRTQQTAEIFREVLAPHLTIEMREGMKPLDAIEDIYHEINAIEENIMIVSHLPFLEQLAAKLLYGKQAPLCFDFSTSAVACLEKSFNEHWKLVLFLG